ncbi:MAG: type III pantothenate kinase [Deltaproteobacteria bacterium]|nr:type III pantothenate kinase [Deltaproteobacteria bacterium]
MLLAIDVGNTNITIGVFGERELRQTWYIATNLQQMGDEYAVLLLNLLKNEGLVASDIDKIAMCSVVPKITSTFNDIFERYFYTKPLVVESGVKTGIRIRMDNPKEVGPDRIVDAVAAHHLYGGPIIIVDLGTATTFDTISKEGVYLGGAIAPGMGTASESLFRRTAMLPSIGLTRPEHAIGTNTITAMQSGMIFGYVGVVESIVSRVQKELDEKAKVVATGGYANLIAKETSIIDIVNLQLTLQGLRLIYYMNRT